MRSEPTFYIVDEAWNVRYACGNPPVSEHRRMPPLLEQTARFLASGDWERPGEAFAVSDDALVRLTRVEGAPDLLCVFLERLRSRDRLAVAVQRFGLTARESDVLKLLIQGVPTATIAKELKIAETTAAVHVKNIAVKTDSRNRSQIIARVLGTI